MPLRGLGQVTHFLLALAFSGPVRDLASDSAAVRRHAYERLSRAGALARPSLSSPLPDPEAERSRRRLLSRLDRLEDCPPVHFLLPNACPSVYSYSDSTLTYLPRPAWAGFLLPPVSPDSPYTESTVVMRQASMRLKGRLLSAGVPECLIDLWYARGLRDARERFGHDNF